MTFDETLKGYIDECGCTVKELSKQCGLNQSTLSRYLNATRTPTQNGKSVEKLAHALYEISKSKDNPLDEREILNDLNQSLGEFFIDNTKLVENFNTLVALLNININRLARAINYDPSHLSRIRSNQRRITNPHEFATKISEYTIKKYNSEDEVETLKRLTEGYGETLSSALYNWLCNGQAEKDNSIANFLNSLESFDLDKFIQSIHFNDIKVPTVPFSLPTSKNYYGIEKMKQCELDFFKTTILSRSKESVFMCSDMPMTDMAKDLDFDKKWMMSIAVMLKKGLKINIIHNLDRPWNEMMLGLEAWIPIYMTGLVTPYYLKNSENNIYHHINYVSGAAAMSGECIHAHHKNGKYYLTKAKDELDYYRRKSEDLLDRASPLMDIYTIDEEEQYKAFLESVKGENTFIHSEAQKVFKNIEILVCPSKWVVISKKEKPYIHFVIRHTRLVSAIENFTTEIEEK